MLTAQDHIVRELAAAQLRDVTTRKIRRPTHPADLVHYLSGDIEGEFTRDGGDIASLWSKTRNSTRRITRKGMDTKWQMVGDNLMPKIDHQETTRQTIVRQLRQSHRENINGRCFRNLTKERLPTASLRAKPATTSSGVASPRGSQTGASYTEPD